MGFLMFILYGFVVGILAKWIIPGKTKGGLIATILLGIVGAVVGGWLGAFLGFGVIGAGFNITSLFISTLSAIVVIAVYRVLMK